MNLKIHHLDCGCFCPASGDALFPTPTFCCHCLLIETEQGLVLLDSGLPREAIHYEGNWLRKNLVRAQMPPQKSAFDQVLHLGFQASDVRHILVTHLDWDHVGGLLDFPEATLHLHRLEAKAMQTKSHVRFNPLFWKNSKKIETYESTGENWNGFQAVRHLRGLPPEILLIPLLGHTLGHSGFAIEQKDDILFHAGDAFYFQEDLEANLKKRNIASDLLQLAMASNNWERLGTLTKISQFRGKFPQVRLINSHDPRLIPEGT